MEGLHYSTLFSPLLYAVVFQKQKKKQNLHLVNNNNDNLSVLQQVYLFFSHNLTITVITRAKLTLGKSFCISQRSASLHMQPAQSERLNYFRKLCVELMFPHQGGGDGSMPMR